MSALRDAMSHAALGWVKPELDETLRLVRNEIELFVEEPGDASRMRFCAGYLHQVQGTLRMMELYAPAMVAEELESLAKAVQAGTVADRDESCATLMRGTVLLPDYLERLQNGHRDIPIVLLPLLNEIRAARGEAGLNESVLFAFNPEAGNATPDEVEHARGSLSGRNRELLDTVGSAVKEELLRVKDALDLHLRTGGDVSELQGQVTELGRVADTLGMMGLGVARNLVLQQRDSLKTVVDGAQQVDEAMLLDIAGALLYVDASLDDQVTSLGAAANDESVAASASSSEVRRTMEVLAHEAIANFSAARENFVAFIETNWDHERLADVPRLLDEVAGALRILELPLPADYLEGVRRYVQNELITKQRIPSGRQLDTLADAMASLEYYLEALRERRPGREDILDITRSSLETLRYWPLPPVIAAGSAAEQPAAAATAAPTVAAPEPTASPAVPETAAPVATDPVPPAPAAPELPPAAREPIERPAAPPAVPTWGLAGLEVLPPSSDAGSSMGISFDPVAAEEGAGGGEEFTVAPIDLSGHDGAEPASTENSEPSVSSDGPGVFDPVAAEQPDHADESVSYTVDLGTLNVDDGSSAAPVETPAATTPSVPSWDLAPTDEAVAEPAAAAPETSAPVADAVEQSEQAEISAADDAGVEVPSTPSAEMPAPEQEADNPFVESAPAPDQGALGADASTPEGIDTAAPVQEGHIGKIDLDDESAAFMAELNAAAANFNVDGPLAPPAAPTPEPPAAPESPVAEPAPVAATPHGGFDDDSEVDLDIREVFLEEFDEELENLGQLLPAWRAAPGSIDNLRPIRRVFHTLKGSGRLVGARTLGEFSWKIESMLNRVLDGSRPASPAVVAMVTQAYEVLPQLNAALRGAGTISADLLAMQSIADRIAAGEDAYYVPSAADVPAEETPVTDEPPVAAADATPAEAPPAPVEPVVAAEPPAAAAPVPAGTPASVDSVLREILEAEVANHLETVYAWLEESQAEPVPATEALLRAVHTMSGAFAMTDVPEITSVTTPAETYVKRSLAASRTPTREGVNGIAETATAIARTVQALRAESPMIPSFAALAERLRALVDTLPEAQWPPQSLDDGIEDTSIEVSAGDDMQLTVPDDLSAYLGGGTQDAQPVELESESEPESALQTHDEPAVETATGGDAIESAEFAVADAEQLTPDIGEAAQQAPIEEIGSTHDAGLSLEPLDHASAPAGEMESTGEVSATDGDDVAGEDGTATPDWQVEEITLESAEAEPVSITETDDASGGAEEVADAATFVQPSVTEESEEVRESQSEDSESTTADDAASIETPAVDTSVSDESISEASVVEASDIEQPDSEATDTEAPIVETHAVGDDATSDQTSVEETTTADEMSVEVSVDETRVEEPSIPTPAVVTPTPEPVEVAEAPTTIVVTPIEAPGPLDLGPLDFNDLDAELVDIFVEEGKDLLDHCDGLLAELRDQPDDHEILAGLQRDLHTLKGGARMAGINAIGDLAHGIESLLEAVAADRTRIAREDVDLLERGFDRLHQLLMHTGNHRAVAMPTDLVAMFEARTKGQPMPADQQVETPAEASDQAAPVVVEPVVAEAPQPADAPASESQAPVEVAAEAPSVPPAGDQDVEKMISAAVEPLSAPVPAEPVLDDESTPGLVRSPHEQVRVRADLLDSLVNHAGEVAIYRSRLEQQLGAFRSAMGELDRTNARLRDQLRRLDLETEAQIVARYQREQDKGDQAFDPLELDRFSTLQQLSRALNESAADLGGLQGVLDDLSRQYDSLLQQQSRVSSELQDGLMRARMVPFDGLVPRLRRVVRQAATDTGKHVQLMLEGAHGELDRNVLERMVAPLEHMLRNSVAHGVESPEQRRAAGKPEEGTIAIRLRREGSEIALEVADDGAGLDRDAIRRRAEERGLIAPGAPLADAELDSLIFASGFSTTDKVSQLAGRGVGMDVVRNEVRQLGGSVDIRSTRGQGTAFILRLPQTLAVTQAVFVRIGETTFAVPVASVSGIGRIARERYESGQGGYHYAGEEYALYELGSLVGQDAATADGAPQVPLLLVRAGDLRAAVAIDQVLGNREIVVKPVGMQIASVPGIYGATVTGDGSVVVILDVAPLVRRHLAQPAQPAVTLVAQEEHHAPLVMVVDDSLTMRKVTSRVLERHNFEVALARDGVEALERLEERVPDLMLLDIEMPRMDGYELATAMRADPRYKDVPIVMITSRSGDKHRQRAFEIGVQRYLGKPYQELDLMRNVYDLLGIARVRE